MHFSNTPQISMGNMKHENHVRNIWKELAKNYNMIHTGNA